MQNFTEAYEFLVSIFGASPFGIIAIDLAGEITLINQKAIDLLNIPLTPNKVIDRNIFDYLGNMDELVSSLNSSLKKGRRAFQIAELALDDCYLSIRTEPILNGQTIIIEDITQRVNAERSALNAILEAQEKERQRLASEIHDGLGPLLSTIRLKTESLKERHLQNQQFMQEQIGDIIELIDTVASDTRDISHALSPASLRKLGLVAALRHLCEKNNESSNIQIDFYANEQIKNCHLDEQTKLNIYRIGQELLNNAIKYSQASHIYLQLSCYNDHLSLSIEDNGKGFQANNNDGKGIGLSNIETRTQAMGGNFEIDSQVGKGVCASLNVPL